MGILSGAMRAGVENRQNYKRKRAIWKGYWLNYCVRVLNVAAIMVLKIMEKCKKFIYINFDGNLTLENSDLFISGQNGSKIQPETGFRGSTSPGR